MEVQRKGHIEKSRQAKAYFFNEENKKRLELKMEALTPEEQEELQTVSDTDLISWFNRTKLDDEKKRAVKTIPGCFYKARAQGAATMQDMNELNKFYKRSLVTCFMVLGHVYALVHFSYESRILSKERLPKLFGTVGFIAYPISIVCLLPWLWKKNKEVVERLDCKYTPIWIRFTARQSLFDDDDDDEDEPASKGPAKTEVQAPATSTGTTKTPASTSVAATTKTLNKQ